jgi:hypothetical protein
VIFIAAWGFPKLATLLDVFSCCGLWCCDSILSVGNQAHELCAQIETVRRIGFKFLRQGCGAVKWTLHHHGGFLYEQSAFMACWPAFTSPHRRPYVMSGGCVCSLRSRLFVRCVRRRRAV